MPNYLAHECFGEAVRRRLPEDLQEAIAEEPALFRSGLYGPDPLLFIPGGLRHARFLHRNWRHRSVSALCEMARQGNCGERSFAAGYLCHQILDDFCHPLILRWKEEDGLSHYRLERGLDKLLLEELGEAGRPKLRAADCKRSARIAEGVIFPAGARFYRVGLRAMAALCGGMARFDGFARGRLRAKYRLPVARLQEVLGEAAASAALLISLYGAGEAQPACALPVPG